MTRDVWHDFWHAFRGLVVFEVGSKTGVVELGAIGTGWIVGPLIARTGHSAATHTEVFSDRPIRAADRRGKWLHAWTVDDPRERVQ